MDNKTHIGVSYNDAEYSRLVKLEVKDLEEGQTLRDLVDDIQKAHDRLFEPLEQFVKEIFPYDHSFLIDPEQYDAIVGVPNKKAYNFIKNAEEKFPTYSFIVTIDPKMNPSSFTAIEQIE
jgi:hypothetical protein